MPGRTIETPAPSAAELVGRDAPWAVLREAMVSGGGRALWVSGQAGIGKTALLERAAAFADEHGTRVVRVTGTEAESPLAFAGLRQLLLPLRSFEAALPPAQRDALSKALELAGGDPPSTLILSSGVLGLLEAAALDRPLLLVVDDVQWIDASSAGVLGFVQRRTERLRMTVLCAARPDHPVMDGAHVLRLGPLTDADALRLLRQRHPELSPSTRRRVLQDAAGHPLALVELAPLYSAGIPPEPSQVPLPERLERVFGAQLRSLTPAARRILLITALAGSTGRSRALVLAALASGGRHATAEDWDAVLTSGLVAEGRVPGTLTFRHPLVRAALIDSTSPEDLRRAHGALAEVLSPDDDHHVIHLADSVAGPDDSIASALDEAARRTVRRGGDPEAATMLARAAELSTEPAERYRRLTEAAAAATRGGLTDLAARVIDGVDRDGLAPFHQVLHTHTLSYLRQNLSGDFRTPLALYPRALRTLATLPDTPSTTALREGLLFQVAFLAPYAGAPELWDDAAAELGRASELTRLCADLWRDPARTARHGADRLRAAVASLPADAEDEAAWHLLWSATAVESFGEFEELWSRIADRAPFVTSAFVDMCRISDGVVRGRWDHCLTLAEQGRASSEAHGMTLNLLSFRTLAVWVHGGRCDEAALSSVERSLGPWADGQAPRFVQQQITGARAWSALGRGDFETAYELAHSITPAGSLPQEAVQFQRSFLTLVEAAVRTGRRDRALRHVEAGRAASMATIGPYHAFVLAAAEAIAADETRFGQACAAAYAVPGSDRWPFELARVRLAHGAWLRRRRKPAEAVEQLLAAQALFARLGTEPWSRRAAEELRAAGYTPAGRWSDVPGAAALTAHEFRIAELAAKGWANKDIGTALGMSPRTVGGHLYRIFPKLGVASRAGLAEALRSAG
ncbi:helix-turn-helix transcriptional regulator [Streptomyces bikiniensis]|uniref:helix-turn-helix transcriptional regulator n=1 Tax=Streptomyces bikiniensis TaxID=1896 RepID=UPI0004C02BC8|nr:LuxR family transcriptional regulator [Streptomyces bikiniensis]